MQFFLALAVSFDSPIWMIPLSSPRVVMSSSYTGDGAVTGGFVFATADLSRLGEGRGDKEALWNRRKMY